MLTKMFNTSSSNKEDSVTQEIYSLLDHDSRLQWSDCDDLSIRDDSRGPEIFIPKGWLVASCEDDLVKYFVFGKILAAIETYRFQRMSFSLEYLEAAYLAHMAVSYENLINRISKKEDVRNFSNGFDASFAEKIGLPKDLHISLSSDLDFILEYLGKIEVGVVGNYNAFRRLFNHRAEVKGQHSLKIKE